VLCTTFIMGCPEGSFGLDWLEPACRDPGWITEVAETVDVEAEQFEVVLAHLLLEVPHANGEWGEDFGDARLYAPALLLGLGHQTDDRCLLAFGRLSVEGNRRLIRMGRLFPLFFWQSLPDQMFAAYGLIEAFPYEHQVGDRGLIDAVVDRLNAALELGGRYPEGANGALVPAFGPTTLTAAVATLNLRCALHVGGSRGPERAEFGMKLIDAITEQAYEPDRGVFRASSDVSELRLYPNVMMIIADCLAYQVTARATCLDRARVTFENIQPLRDPNQGNYYSPYSAESMGAQTEDYSSLSSQLYLITALNLLYESTGDEQYQHEAEEVLHFVCTHLRADGRLVHHWIDGRQAEPNDPTYYCSGCNFQALHVMWYMSRLRPR
jgi:hypothetical protein